MATQTLTRLYDSHSDAVSVVQALEAAGISHDHISIVGQQAAGTAGAVAETPAAKDAGIGASLGTVVGGGAGLLAGIGALAIPGVGPVVAAGWLVAALTGAGVGAAVGGGAGGIVGSLTNSGVSERDAHVYAEGVRRGGSLVSVRADDAQTATVQQVLDRHTTVDPVQRRSVYEHEGWSTFDEKAPAYDRSKTPLPPV